MLEVAQGYLTATDKRVRQCPSTHCDARPMGEEINLLVIHNISLPPGEFGGGFVEAFFTDKLDFTQHSYFNEIKALRVSAHIFIDRAGDITQFVSFNDRAWHAGESVFRGRPACNDYSIGIELEGTDETAYTEEQYQSLVELTRALMQRYPQIIPERIVGHSDIAPGRKSDPGAAFDWQRYFSQLSQ